MLSLFKKNNIDGEWRTVAELKVGQNIAVPREDVLNSHTAGKIDSRKWMGENDVEWDEIESIEYKGTEQVWDIEVEGTHNFVGNNIFAHNTYVTGSIGVGTSTPWAKLSVANYSAGASTNPLFIVASSTGASATSTNFIIDSLGNVGIGSTTPGTLLSLGDTGGINFGLATSTFSTTGGINLTAGCYAVNGVCIGSGGGAAFVNTLANGGTATTTFYNGGIVFSDGSKLTQSASTANFFWDETNKNLGIGSALPSALLTLQGAGTAKDLFTIASSSTSGNIITISQWGGFTQNISSSTAFNVNMASGTPVFSVDTTQSDVNAGMDITAATGQTANLLNLYSSGGSFLSGFTAEGGLFMNISSSTAINLFDGSGNTAFVVNSTGKSVGIGTSTLAYALTVQDNQAATYVARIDNANTGTDADGLLISLGVANASRTTSNYFVAFADGTQTVAGKIQGGASAVAYTTTAADLAEYFRASDLNDLPKPGEIVVLDKNKDRSVVIAGSQGETLGTGQPKVSPLEPLGIISTNPGFIGNGPICLVSDADCDQNYAKYNVMVAIAGQVPVRVSLENGPIAVGDYLTLSSTTPGVAVKMIESGYIVGVATNVATTTAFAEPLPDGVASTTPITYEKVTTVNSFIKSGWREIASTKTLVSADGLTQTQVPSMWAPLFDFFKQIGLEIGNGFIKIANLVTDKILANKVQTKELCIDDVCVDKTQLQAMLSNAGVTASSTPSVPPSPDQGEGQGGVVASTTPEIIPDTASSTPEIIPSTEPVATTTPEIIPIATTTPPIVEQVPTPIIVPAPTEAVVTP